MVLRSFVISALLAAPAVPAAAQPLAPTSKWTVNFADSQCIAVRAYGTATDPLRFVLKAPPLGGVMQIAVIRPAPRMTRAEQADLTVGVDERPPLKTSLLMYTPKGAKERVYLLNMPAEEFARVREARKLTLRSPALNQTFALSQMAPLLKVMQDCVEDLRRVWNVSPLEGGTPPNLTRRAQGDLSRYFSDGDYPAAAISKSLSGRVRFALLVGEDGKVADCTVIETSGVAVLDGQACALVMQRAKFQPALGTDGKPAKDALIAAIMWKMREY
jgi:TonB family protein